MFYVEQMFMLNFMFKFLVRVNFCLQLQCLQQRQSLEADIIIELKALKESNVTLQTQLYKNYHQVKEKVSHCDQ